MCVSEKKIIDEKDKQEIYEEIKIKFTSGLETISYSQLSRFYSLIESKEFELDKEYDCIEKFIENQIKRGKSTQKEKLLNAQNFYETFKAEILDKHYSKEKSKVIMDILKEYTRYINGKKKLLLNTKNVNKGGN